jgi:hypothetical protein
VTVWLDWTPGGSYRFQRALYRQVLAEVYGWFIEGFDTRDWQEAKALLQELSSR